MPDHINIRKFSVSTRARMHLHALPTEIKPFYRSHDHFNEILARHTAELSALQSVLHAHDHYALLVIVQGMDASGKDGAIKHVMTGINPEGCQVFEFKRPSDEEHRHDFLWRTSRCLPERGRIGIFNRSYYEEVLVVRVHPELLRDEAQPAALVGADTIWDARFQAINGFERHLYNSGTRVLKFFLHVSKEEQRRRLLKRIDEPSHNWKFSNADLQERAFWGKYVDAYDACLSATSTAHAPWYVVPADDKKNACLIISQTIINTLNDLKLEYPPVSKSRAKELQELRKQLR